MIFKTNLIEFSLKARKTEIKKVRVTTSKDAHGIAFSLYGDDIIIFETFFILLMNRYNTIIGYAKISQGGTSGTVVDTKIVAKIAIEGMASSIILVHNHPSGNKKPSNADIELTRKIKAGMELLDVAVLDHLIVTDEEYYSFADEGRI